MTTVHRFCEQKTESVLCVVLAFFICLKAARFEEITMKGAVYETQKQARRVRQIPAGTRQTKKGGVPMPQAGQGLQPQVVVETEGLRTSDS